jgi:glycosyltransferase involved in cell wall biosynthesis
MTRAPRIALVTNVLAHYRVPCFHALAARMPGRIEFFLLTAEMPHRAYVLAGTNGGPRTHVLSGFKLARPPLDDVHLNDVRPVLRGRDLVILGGWAEPSYLLLWSMAQLARCKTAFWIESTLQDRGRGPVSEGIKRTMLGRARGVVAAGTSAAEYCRVLGMADDRVYRAPNAVNTDYFRKKASILASSRKALRGELRFNAFTILFVGRLVESLKNVSTLLKAQSLLEKRNAPVELILVGEGPDRDRYEQLVRALGLTRVRIDNFVGHDALCQYYAAANVLVLPSRSEPWGFVINEAMEFGLPIVASTAVGAAADLVRMGENGYVFSPDDVVGLAAVLEKLANDSRHCAELGAASRRRIEPYTPEAWAEGFAHAIGVMTA